MTRRLFPALRDPTTAPIWWLGDAFALERTPSLDAFRANFERRFAPLGPPLVHETSEDYLHGGGTLALHDGRASYLAVPHTTSWHFEPHHTLHASYVSFWDVHELLIDSDRLAELASLRARLDRKQGRRLILDERRPRIRHHRVRNSIADLRARTRGIEFELERAVSCAMHYIEHDESPSWVLARVHFRPRFVPETGRVEFHGHHDNNDFALFWLLHHVGGRFHRCTIPALESVSLRPY